MFPVYLKRVADQRFEDLLRSTHQEFRDIPTEGIGYGALRYLSNDPAIQAQLAALPSAEISFLYRGAAASQTGDQLFLMDSQSSGRMHASDAHLTHRIAIDNGISNGRLELRCVYDSGALAEQTIAALLQNYIKTIRELLWRFASVTQPASIQNDAAEFEFSAADMDLIAASLSRLTEGTPHEKR